MSMNIGQIRFFVCAAELGSFSQAAKEQNVTVQAVSKAIIGLEGQLGRELFIRGSRQGVTPTEFGRAFYQKAREVVHGFDELENFGRSYAASMRGSSVNLLLDVPPFNNYERTCVSLGAFLSRQSGSKVQMRLMMGDEAYESLSQGAADAVISLGENPREGLDCTKLGTVVIGFAMAAGHDLTACSSITPQQACQYPIARTEHFGAFNDAFFGVFERLGLEPQVVPFETTEDYAQLITRDRALVPCVAMDEFVNDLPKACTRPLKVEGALRPTTIPVFANTLKSFKSPQYLAVEKCLCKLAATAL